MKMTCYIILLLATSIIALSSGPPAQAQANLPRDIGITQKLDAQLPLDLRFRDETGKVVRLGDYFGQKPVILNLVYYRCPMLCTMVLNGLTESLTQMALNVGKDFNVVTVSFDARETPELATEKKAVYLKRYGRTAAAQGWPFLTGDEAAIRQLADAVGFKFAYDAATNQFAHATGIMVATPDGKLSRYFYGIEYPPTDLRLALVESSSGKIGNLVDQVLLLCYHYDPATGKYTRTAVNLMRMGGLATVVGLAILFFGLQRKYRTPKRVDRGEPQCGD